jgi:4-hydroxy-2-oxoheptanedioate aldolase
MRTSRIKAKLAQNQPTLVVTLHLTDPSVFELASLMGFDGLWIDLEHHAHSVETAQNLMRAARVGQSDIIARPAKGEFMRMGRMLEAGAQGIMYPRCDNAAEAAEVVKWAKFPPLGKRGCDGGNPDMPYVSMPYGQYVKEANEQTFIFIQIEDPAALEHAEAMAAVEGVDGIMFGPADFSSLSGFPGHIDQAQEKGDHPRVVEAMQHIAKAVKRAGKHWGRPAGSVEAAREYMAMGARFICYGGDIVFLKEAFERTQNIFSPEGFNFDNRLSPPTLLRQTSK